jgi:uncharacterized protein (DUF885 family)
MMSTVLLAIVALLLQVAQFHVPLSVGSDFPVPGDAETTAGVVRGLVERYGNDAGSLERMYPLHVSPLRLERMRPFYGSWLAGMEALQFSSLSGTDQADYLLFTNYLRSELRRLDLLELRNRDMALAVPFLDAIATLDDDLRRMKPVQPEKSAAMLNTLFKDIEALNNGTKRPGKSHDKSSPQDIDLSYLSPVVANRAAATVESLRRTMKRWFEFYAGYDPLFTWWVEAPYRRAEAALKEYTAALKGMTGVGRNHRDAIIGDPIGCDALLSELRFEMIPYSPEELINIANKEFSWCEAEMKNASRELGYGDEWHRALEHVKDLHVEPGRQPQLIRELALEAEKFLEDRDLITIPPLAKESWRMEMMSPEQQKVSPFFLGGETIIVSYPVDSMQHEQKMMSMRGNNIHFSRATVHHELIPGHHLQSYMNARHKSYRGVFGTPFWTEGWALYWEMRLWDLGFPHSPEDRIGMLFWRMHRCARIIFSLNFHLGRMSPQECIDLLVEKVGHERDNATAEVRRSFSGDYPPLYQIAYMVGALQLRALHTEIVGSGRMGEKEFHDAVLKENAIPIEMLRAIMLGEPLTQDYSSRWRFYDKE